MGRKGKGNMQNPQGKKLVFRNPAGPASAGFLLNIS
jgi:hypothetical protein